MENIGIISIENISIFKTKKIEKRDCCLFLDFLHAIFSKKLYFSELNKNYVKYNLYIVY